MKKVTRFGSKVEINFVTLKITSLENVKNFSISHFGTDVSVVTSKTCVLVHLGRPLRFQRNVTSLAVKQAIACCAEIAVKTRSKATKYHSCLMLRAFELRSTIRKKST